jgi:hypothetical protein
MATASAVAIMATIPLREHDGNNEPLAEEDNDEYDEYDKDADIPNDDNK